jgi:hypothetical protein
VIDDEASSLDQSDAFADIIDAFTRQEVTIMSTTTKTIHRSFASLKLPNKVPAMRPRCRNARVPAWGAHAAASAAQ